MTQPSPPTTVWIVDDDLGFVWWLGDLFNETGCRALPALACDQAVSLIKALKVGVDLLVLNPQLPGVVKMLQTLRSSYPSLKLVLIDKPSAPLSNVIHPRAILERPSGSDKISRLDWLKKVQKLLKDVATVAAV